MAPRLPVSRPFVLAHMVGSRQARSLTKTRLTRIEQSDSVGDGTPVTRRQKLHGGKFHDQTLCVSGITTSLQRDGGSQPPWDRISDPGAESGQRRASVTGLRGDQSEQTDPDP